MTDLLNRSACDLVADLRAGTLSVADLMAATLDRIAALNPAVNAIVALRDAADLMAEARAADAVPTDTRGALHGLPMAIKELCDVKGMVTSMGMPSMAGNVAQADELMVARLRAAGAIFIGKTNVPQFGLGSHSYNAVYGTTANAYDATRAAGGSSGGAGVALACRMVALADGSDVMGSLRNPAAWSNVYGFRPSWGRVPQDRGPFDADLRLSTLGPMARSPRDLALLLDVQAGPDPADPFAMAFPPVLPQIGAETAEVAADVAGRRIGWLGDWGGAFPMAPDLLELCATAVRGFEDLGCVVEDVPPPFDAARLWECWVGLRAWDKAAGMGALYHDPDRRGDLKPEAVWEVETGLALSAVDVQRLSAIRQDWFLAAQALFDRYDALVLPATQVWPFAADIDWPDQIEGRRMDTYHRWMEGMVPAGILGLPTLAVPAGFGAAGLPGGLQIMGRLHDDARILQLGQAWHGLTGWPDRRPPAGVPTGR